MVESHRPPANVRIGQVDQYEFRQVDRYLQTMADVWALQAAFESELIQNLQGSGSSLSRLPTAGQLPRDEWAQLHQSNVLETIGEKVQLTVDFRRALEFESLLRTKIRFIQEVFPDPNSSPWDPNDIESAGRSRSRLLELFDYSRALDDSEDNRQHVARWMGITTELTRHEAGVCLDNFDFASFSNAIDIGGNSGEMARQICSRHKHIEITVLDLPLVCQAGRQHLESTDEASRIRFATGDILATGVPSGFDLIIFKSMLHDWPDVLAEQILSSAARSLEPAGSILIFERIDSEHLQTGIPASHLPLAMFQEYYRHYDWYLDRLAKTGFDQLDVVLLDIDLRFVLLRASRQPL